MANFLISRTDTHIERWISRFEGNQERALMTWACRMPRKFSLIFQMLRPTPTPAFHLDVTRNFTLSNSEKAEKRANEQSQAINTFSIHHAMAIVCMCLCLYMKHSKRGRKYPFRPHCFFSPRQFHSTLVVLFRDVHTVCGMCINQINYLCFWINPQLINKWW